MAIKDTSSQDRIIAPQVNRKRRAMQVGGAVVALLVIAWLAPSAWRLFTAGRSVSAARLQIATVERGAFVRDIAAEGSVVAAVSPTLYASAPGAVVLKVHAGDAVTKDQVVAVIDSPELKNKLAQEQSNADAMNVDYKRAQIDSRKQRLELQKNLDNAGIDAKSAQTDLERNERAFKNGAIAQMQVAHAQDTLDKAHIALKHAQEDMGLDNDSLTFNVQSKKLAWERQVLIVKDLQRQVDDLNVRSPVNGQVGQLFIAPSATVAKDAKLLSVVDLSALEVEVKVPESFARDLAIGMNAQISGNGNQWKGTVGAISPEVVNGEVAARVRFDGDEPAHLRQNQRLSVRILLDKRDNTLTVARGSFVDESGGRYAYVVRDGIAVKTPVTLGPSSIDKVEVLQGLKAGDRIVISGTDNFNGAERVALSN
ncbi:MAG TPA: efflux RND transporter periplasmic adaptor subunit [Rudaea sp.]|nr:efflux RND transporter periplasmic adaptor subunit [Pseudomonadota bacterium]HMM56978.1 efflux RND transporter periplasmic adaptor subunit [Rudaea sp.]